MAFGWDDALAIGVGLLGSGGKKKQTTDTTPKFAREIAPYIQPAVGRVLQAGQDTPYGGQRVAGLTTRQTQGLSMADALAQSLGGQQQTIGENFQRFASGDLVGSNPYLEQQITNMREGSARNLERRVLPQIRNNAVADGGIGGTRQGIAEGIATGDAEAATRTAEMQMRGQAYQQDMQNQLNALINNKLILEDQTRPMDVLMTAGGVQQAQTQAELNAQRQKWDEQQMRNYQRQLEILQTLLGSPVGQRTQTTGPGANPLVSGLGAYTAWQGLKNPAQNPINQMIWGGP